MRSFPLFIPVLLASASAALAAEKKGTVTVEAGDYERKQTIVTFALPPELRTCNAVRQGGNTVPLQVDKLGQGSFVVPDLKKGAKATYDLLQPRNAGEARPKETMFALGTGSSSASPLPALKAAPWRPRCPCSIIKPSLGAPRENIKPAFARGAYLHPIRTLAGRWSPTIFHRITSIITVSGGLGRTRSLTVANQTSGTWAKARGAWTLCRWRVIGAVQSTPGFARSTASSI
jgi:hypothetical protein